MEMEDTLEMDTDDVFTMQDISFLDVEEENRNYPQQQQPPGLTAIGAEGLFRAGTPTPVITPPFPQITLPPTHPVLEPITMTTASHTTFPFQDLEPPNWEAFGTLPLLMSDTIFEGMMEEEINTGEEYVGVTHEVQNEELDTECIVLFQRFLIIRSLGCTTS
jgi:hypothetical protein